MKYYVNTNELCHWGLKKGEQAKKHKYIARIGTSPNYTYFYTLSEYQSYLKGSAKKISNNIKKSTSNTANSIKKSASNAVNKATNYTKNTTKKVSDYTKKIINSKSSVSSKNSKSYTPKRINSEIEKTFNTVLEKTNQAVSSGKRVLKSTVNNGKKYADSLMSKTLKSVERSSSTKLGSVEYYTKPREKSRSESTISAGGHYYTKCTTITYKDGTVKEIKNDYTKNDDVPTSTTTTYYNKYHQKIDTPEWDKPGYKADNILQSILKTAYNLIDSIPNSQKVTDFLFPKLSLEDKDKNPSDGTTIDNSSDMAISKYLPTVSKEENTKIRLINTNPHYPKSGYVSNCPSCTLAYDLRRRGYDVSARSMPEGLTVEEISYLYSDPEKVYDQFDKNTATDRAGYEKAKQEMLACGEGAGGHAAFYWTDGGGHDAYWEIKDGQVMIRDGQIGMTYTIDKYLELSDEFTWARTDDIEVSAVALLYVNSGSSENVLFNDMYNTIYKSEGKEAAEEFKEEVYDMMMDTLEKDIF